MKTLEIVKEDDLVTLTSTLDFLVHGLVQAPEMRLTDIDRDTVIVRGRTCCYTGTLRGTLS